MTSPSSDATSARRARSVLGLAVVILLMGWWLRTASLQPFSHLLHHDEAWYGLNALDLIAHPRLVTFFPENYGRESGWMYLLAGWISVFGQDIAGLRILAAFVGILTLATMYRLGRELADAWTGLFSLAALAVLFWHVMVSQHIVRLNFALLLTTLAVLACLRALHNGGRWRWVRAGLLTGALAYTYFAALGVIALLGMAAGVIAWRRPDLRPSLALCAAMAVVILTPQAIYALSNLGAFTTRSATVARLDVAGLAENGLAWMRAWWIQGDLDDHYNLSGRPILDPWSAFAFLAGLGILSVDLVRRRPGLWHRPWGGAFVVIWLAVTVAPSLVTAGAPSFSRAALALAPIGLLLGYGVRVLGAAIARLRPRPSWLAALPLGLLVPMAISGYQDLHGRWITFAQRTAFMEAPLMYGFERARLMPAAQPLYFSPFSIDHPVLRFMAPALVGHPTGAFDSHQCVALSDQPATYFSLSDFEDLTVALQPWAHLSERERRTDLAGATLVEANPTSALSAVLAQPGAGLFADQLEIWPLVVAPTAPKPGEAIRLSLAVRVRSSPQAPLGVFVHVYGDPPPAAGGRLWAQIDTGVCDSYPPTRWRRDEVILKTLELDLPADLPPGPYQLAVGLYTYPAIERLPLTRPDPGTTTLTVATWTVP